jgi:hypothetical protein
MPKLRQNLRVEPVGLGQLPETARKLPHLTWIDYRDCYISCIQLAGEQAFQSTSRFEYHHPRPQLDHSRD